ncbi:MAG: UvrD-helicase domain-containing protein, partial [Bryobacteraceae bacterium]
KSTDAVERERLGVALRHIERAFIGTIHAFCAQMLRQRPVEAGIDPAFTELAQPEAERLFARVFQRWIEVKLAGASPVVERALTRSSWREEQSGVGGPMAALRGAAWSLIEWRDFPSPWRREAFHRDEELDWLLLEADGLLQLRAKCARPESDKLYASLQIVADFRERVRSAIAVGHIDYDAWESDLVRLPRELRWSLRQGGGPYAPGIPRESILDAWRQLESSIERFRERADADLAASLRDELWPLAALYQDAKSRSGQLDFTDLLIRARSVLHHDAARSYFQNRYHHIFLDEFQDTDPLQAEILMLLVSSDAAQRDWRAIVPAAGKLFLVGDPKQSIYRFRRADVELYRDVCSRLASQGVKKQQLLASRRSVEPIQQFVNAAFRDRMPDYLPLDGGRPGHAGQPAVLALPMPFPYGMRGITKTAINKCSPNAVAAFIEWLVNKSGWMVSDPLTSGRLIPVAPGHICILFRRFTNNGVDLTQEYVRCLEARGTAHVLVGSKSFHNREEVSTIRTALRAIEWPDDELSVFATVRGSLFAVSDGTLLKFRHHHGSLHPFKVLPEGLDMEFEPVRDALKMLAGLHRRRNYHPIADTIHRLLEHTRAHAGFAFRKGGERVLANVYRLTDLARSFEATSATSFRSFVEYLEEGADAGEAAEAPLLEQSADGVKLMTVHRAKGLEFPVVILADLTANLTAADGGGRHVDSLAGLCAQRLLNMAPWELLDAGNRERENRMDREEAERVAYVAATRARDILVVSAVGDSEFDNGWLSPLYDALYPARHLWRTPGPAPGCGPFGGETVLSRPQELGYDEVSVKPGLHHARQGEHPVVWFDPAVLDLTDRKSAGLEHEDVLSGSPDAGLNRYREWQTRRLEVIARGSAPAFRMDRATEAAALGEQTILIEVVALDKRGTRPSGRMFGKLVHALLQRAAFPVDAASLAANAVVEARILGAPSGDIPAAVAAAMGALSHPLLSEAGSAKRLHREWPVLLRQEDGTLIEGTIDLAFSDGAHWTIVDFKTSAAGQLRYRRQLQHYGLAVSKITGLPVRGVLFEV